MSLLLGNRIRASLRWLVLGGVLLASAEAATRIEDAVRWGAPLVGPYSHDRLMTRDTLGLRGRPNFRFEQWRMNNAGFRGPDISLLPAPGVTRIAVLGASETFGLYESEGSEYPARLQGVLDSVAPGRFEVINAGLAGLSLTAMASYYDRAVARTQPTFVLIYPSPTFYLEVVPLLEMQPTSKEPLPQGGTYPDNGVISPVSFQSRLLRKGRDVLKEIIPVSLVSAYRDWQLGRVRAVQEPGWVWETVPQDRMALMEKHLEHVVATIQSSGSQVVLLTHTNRYLDSPAGSNKIDRRHLINLMSVYYPRASTQVMIGVDSIANRIIRDVAQRRGARVIEVEGRIPGTDEFFADYAHFTDVGADAMAHILSARVLSLADLRLSAPATTYPNPIRLLRRGFE